MPMYFGYRAHQDHAVPFDDGMQRKWHWLNQDGESDPVLKRWIRHCRYDLLMPARDIVVEYECQMKERRLSGEISSATSPSRDAVAEDPERRRRREALERHIRDEAERARKPSG